MYGVTLVSSGTRSDVVADGVGDRRGLRQLANADDRAGEAGVACG